MDRRIMWKKYSRHDLLSKFIRSLAFASCLSFPICPLPLQAIEAEDNRLPTIRQVAIMPVYWQGQFPTSPSFTRNKQHLDAIFSKLVRDSHRFVFSNDVLTADLWASPEGRRQLSEDYEIDAFINLTMSSQGDLLQWTTRLLNPTMKTYLTESERIPYSWLAAASPSNIDQRLQNLLFRLLNRYPVDVYVTSIQGRYITLSSGSEQNIFENDELKFFQTTIKSLHPIDGSWLGFDQKLLGQARVIESKKHSSIAQITSLSYADAIGIGDGARVEAIASRRPFQKKSADEPLFVAIEQGSPIVESRKQRNHKNEIQELTTPKKPLKVASNELEVKLAEKIPNPRTNEDEGELKPSLSSEPNPEADSDLASMLPMAFKELHFQALHERFNIRGSAKALSQFPSLVLNRFAVAGLQDINADVKAALSADIRFGSTKKGSYFGFGLGFEPLYQKPIRVASFPSLEKILIGGLIKFDSVAVSGEKLGGWDVLSASPSVHLQGTYHIADLVQTYDYDFAARITPFGIGQVGISGKKRKIGSSEGLELEAHVIHKMKAQEWEWGGLLAYQTAGWDLSKGAVSLQNLRLGLLGRMRL